MIDLYLACVKTGVIFVPVNVLYREREVSHIVRDAEPAAVVADGDVPGVSGVWQAGELLRESAALPADPPQTVIDGDDAAAIIYTSGTTGQSKGAVLTHNNFAANALNLTFSWRFSPSDRLLLGLPLFHVHGLGNGVHCWLLSGCRMRLLTRFEHQTAAEEFASFQPTVFLASPPTTSVCSILAARRERSARPCDCSSPDQRLCRRKCWRSSRRASDIASSSGTG